MALNRTTQYFSVDDLARAAEALRCGAIVAFPTETVYGLGADAFNPEAIARVFEAKGRPHDNPLIVHISDITMLPRVAAEIPAVAHELIDQFWPGPLTLLLPKSKDLPTSVTAGLSTVAVRIPSDPIARDLIRLADTPLVAPSANLSGRPSGTTWQAVADDLDGRIDGIICGNATQIGLESTVLDLMHHPARILRPGAVDVHRLRRISPDVVEAEHLADHEAAAVPSPGMKHRHYQPNARVRVLRPRDIHRDPGTESTLRGWIGIHLPFDSSHYAMVVPCQNVDEYAARLFDAFRMMDNRGIELIDCEAVPVAGIGRALMDRIERASSK